MATEAPILCGRGDKKTKKGKRFKGSYGSRPKKEHKVERIKDKIEIFKLPTGFISRPCLELEHVKRIEKLLDESGEGTCSSVVKDIGGGLREQNDAVLCCQESDCYDPYQHRFR
ncbi:hypothetical protein OROHE_006747 [Orobanche hederae]